MFRIVGPFIQGITLVRDSSNLNYLPTFHLHNLGSQEGDFISLTIKTPLLTEKTRYPDKITVSRHEKDFSEIVNRFSKQLPLPMTGKIPAKKVIKAYEGYIRSGGASTRYPLFEFFDMVCVYIWINKLKKAQDLFDSTLKEIHGWPSNITEPIKDSLRKYQDDLGVMLENPQKLKDKVKEAIDSLNLSNFPQSNIE